MANLLLTNKCVRECPYCFAGREMASSSESDYLSWENVVYLADFLSASGEKRLSLLGGEPTLHPAFVDILLYFIERGFDVNVFTSGLLSKARLDELGKHLAPLAADSVNFVCNINNPEQTATTAAETEKLHAFLTTLAPRTMISFNLYRPDFELDFLFDLVERYPLKRRLRLGIAHPIPGVANQSIEVGQIGAVIERLCAYKNAFLAHRVRPHFDCGFPLCQVTDEQLGWLTRLSGRIHFKCHPAIDITPDMQVYCCFPLSNLARRSIFEFNSFGEVLRYYRTLQQRIRSVIPGIYEECGHCDHRSEQTCAGGAVCQLVKRLADEAPLTLRNIENEHCEAGLP